MAGAELRRRRNAQKRYAQIRQEDELCEIIERYMRTCINTQSTDTFLVSTNYEFLPILCEQISNQLEYSVYNCRCGVICKTTNGEVTTWKICVYIQSPDS